MTSPLRRPHEPLLRGAAKEKTVPSEPGERARSLGVRRSVEVPETDIDAAEDLAPAAESAPQQTAEEKTAKEGEDAAPAQAIAVAPPPDAGAPVDGGPPPDRPKKPVLARVAIAGAVLLAVPLLLIATGSHDRKKRAPSAADRVLPGDSHPVGPREREDQGQARRRRETYGNGSRGECRREFHRRWDLVVNSP